LRKVVGESSRDGYASRFHGGKDANAESFVDGAVGVATDFEQVVDAISNAAVVVILRTISAIFIVAQDGPGRLHGLCLRFPHSVAVVCDVLLDSCSPELE
jgi:hypothetical protein